MPERADRLVILRDGERRCSACGLTKPLSEFYRSPKPIGYRSACKDCQKAKAASDYKENPEKHRSRMLRRVYGLSLKDYQRMLDSQGGGCAICGSEDPSAKNRQSKWFSVDHDHTTGKVRGLLCHWCNAGLGYFQDHPEVLKRAMKYLEEHNA